MATKMKIYEIARSMQEKVPDLKSKDVVQFLQENGFEVKSAQSTIEDDAIAFLLRNFKKIKIAAAKPKEAAAKSATKKEKTNPKTSKSDTSKKEAGNKGIQKESAKKETRNKDVSGKEELSDKNIMNKEVINKVDSDKEDADTTIESTEIKNMEVLNKASSDKKNVNEDVQKSAADSEGSNKETVYNGVSDKEVLSKEVSNKETINKEVSVTEASNKEVSNKEVSNKEALNKETLNKEASNKEAVKKETTNKENGNKENDSKENDNKENIKKETVNKESSKKETANKKAQNKGASNKQTKQKSSGEKSDNMGRDIQNSDKNSNRNNNSHGGDNRDSRNANRNGGRRDNRDQNGRDSGRNDNNRNGRDNRDRNNRDNRGEGRNNKDKDRDNRSSNRSGRDNRNGSRGNNGHSGAAMSVDSMKSEVKQSRQQRANKDSRSAKQRRGKNRERDEIDDELFGQTKNNRKKKDPNRKGAFIKPEPVAKPKEPEDGIRTITLPEKLTIKELSDIMKVQASTVIKNLFMRGQVVTLNHEITFDEAEEIALEYNCIAEQEEKIDLIAEILKEDEEDVSLMKKRPPVVCVMGHVDHGKTSLLDAIRETHVTSREAGGITQHIGAYVTEINGEKITFLDTPGHEAFTSMRMRGAQSTDIAILVVAADDGVMPQTVEAINHAKAAGVEIIVAVNKIDKPSANIERVKQELVEHGLVAEDWGGDTVFVPVSAHTKEGIDALLEMIIITAEVLELKANPNRKARGVVIEAQLDKGRGPVATVLVQKGTLHVGDNIAVGSAYGKIRAMMDDNGRRVKEALPSTPVEILGLHDVPDAGEIFMATENDKEARNIAETYIEQGREKLLDDTKSKLTLDGLFSQIQAGNIKELNLIVKADVQGSVEAVKQSLLKLTNEEVAVRIIHGAVGAINESDVSLASASNAIIIGFNVRPDNTAKEIAEREKVDVRLYRVIYNAIEDIEAAMKGMLDPEYEERIIGHLEVRQLFKASGVGVIAGSYVLDGKIVRGCKVRISRDGEQIFEGELASLKRFKDDVKEVATGYECGLVFEGFNEVKEEDKIEAYIMAEVPRV